MARMVMTYGYHPYAYFFLLLPVILFKSIDWIISKHEHHFIMSIVVVSLPIIL